MYTLIAEISNVCLRMNRLGLRDHHLCSSFICYYTPSWFDEGSIGLYTPAESKNKFELESLIHNQVACLQHRFSMLLEVRANRAVRANTAVRCTHVHVIAIANAMISGAFALQMP